jgi:tetratricopeptide (TPR) repeat protein
MANTKGDDMRLAKLGTCIVILCFFASCMTDGRSGKAGGPTGEDLDSLWDYDNPEASEMSFRRLIPDETESVDTAFLAELLTQIARAQGLQMKFEDAHQTLDQAESLLEERMKRARIRYLLERGRVFNSSGEREKSQQYFLDAWKLGRGSKQDYYMVDALHMLAIVAPADDQLSWAEAAMDAAEKSKDERTKKWLGSLYNNTGWTYHDLGELDKALDMFEKSLEWNRVHGDSTRVRIARWTIARAYRSLDRLQEALEIQLALEQEIDTEGVEPDGYVYEEIAECLLGLGRDEESKPYFKLAFEHLSKNEWMKANEADRLKRLEQLSM